MPMITLGWGTALIKGFDPWNRLCTKQNVYAILMDIVQELAARNESKKIDMIEATNLKKTLTYY